MHQLNRPIITGSETADFTVNLQPGGFSNAGAVRRARGDSGSSISWIVGCSGVTGPMRVRRGGRHTHEPATAAVGMDPG